ncbi:MAG: restriction endonuclease subunit S, partial [Treponema sp.]|nr:restriction endonuclease subunit S [Treponema sp.]
NATVLLEKIRAEKAEKIKKGELKANKKDSFIFLGSDKRHYEQFADGTVKDIEDEIPFEVPEGWAWCRLTNVAITELGKTLDAKKNKGESYDYLCALNVKWYTFDFTTLKQIRLEEKEKERYLVRKGDLLICEGGDVGRSAIWESDNPIYYQNALHRVRFYQNINQYFFLHVLNYYKNIGLIDDVSGGVTIKHFTQNSMQKLLFPLPPLVEQEQIVSLIKTIFFQIEILEQNKTELQDAIKQTKSKILDLAIHGKLVPQNPNDEPAEQLLKRIATSDNRPYKKFDDEEPFDIPESWSWCTLGEIYTHTTGKALKKTNNKGTLRKYITTSNLYWNSFDFTEVREMYFTDDELEKCTIKKGDLILCNGGDVGRAAIWNYDYDICYQNHVSRLRPKNEKINNSFFLYLMMIYKQQGMLNGKGVGITSLSASDLLSAVVPLPPYSEQNRITKEIECLYEQLNIINNQL